MHETPTSSSLNHQPWRGARGDSVPSSGATDVRLENLLATLLEFEDDRLPMYGRGPLVAGVGCGGGFLDAEGGGGGFRRGSPLSR
mmetsp:Transcript_40583/g.114937  ORF Transcript_40583/g.114937 Transcript_40583/m.114937 type:complete len:85 (+) Transcript_40583:335-589(+)